MTPAEVVLDASVAVRGLLGEGESVELVNRIAKEETLAHAPDLVIPEVTNALRMRIHAGRWPVEEARERLDVFQRWPIEVHRCGPLGGATLEAAAERGISAYDAFYAVLAEVLEIPLLTADRRLAAAVPGALLVA